MNIESWEYLVAPNGMHRPPDGKGGVFRGPVFGHPEIKDGTVIHTAEIIGWDFRDSCFVDSNGGEFRLKDPDPAYESAVPKAKTKFDKAVTDRKFMMTPAMYFARAKT